MKEIIKKAIEKEKKRIDQAIRAVVGDGLPKLGFEYPDGFIWIYTADRVEAISARPMFSSQGDLLGYKISLMINDMFYNFWDRSNHVLNFKKLEIRDDGRTLVFSPFYENSETDPELRITRSEDMDEPGVQEWLRYKEKNKESLSKDLELIRTAALELRGK